MFKQLHFIILHKMCKHDMRMINKWQKKYTQHNKRFLDVYNKGFKERTGDNDT